MIRVGETGTIRTAADAEVALLRARFRERHAVKIPGFLEPTFLSRIQSRIHTATFVPRSHEGIGHDLVCLDSPAADALLFVLNDPRLCHMITELTGIGPIGCFIGRLYRMTAATAHHASWHSDVADHRLVALSINIGEEPYRGGTTILREQGRPDTEQPLENTTPGDALLFRIDPTLEHHVTDVEPGPPKTAWAGWFRSEPSFLDVLTGKATF
jgi:hypothetical protein